MRLDNISRGFAAQAADAVCAFAQSAGYSPQMIERGFRRMFAHWTPEEWAQFFRRELPLSRCGADLRLCDADISDALREQIIAQSCPDRRIFRRVALIPASTVPSASFQEICQILTLPVRLTVRPPQAQRPIYSALKAVIDRHMPRLGARLTIAPSSHDDAETRNLFIENDVVNVSGSDSTIARCGDLCASLPPAQRPILVAHGHRVSAVIMRSDDFLSLTDEDYRRLAADASDWDQTGCLSPKFAFIETDFASACAFANRLCEALDAFGGEIPPLPGDIAAGAEKNSALLTAMIDGACVARSPCGDAVAVYPPGAPFIPLSLPRLLQVFCVSDAAESVMRLAPRGQQLATRAPIGQRERAAFAKAGFNIFCTFGNMQDPPMTWFHDGIGTLAPLFEKPPQTTACGAPTDEIGRK